MVYGCLSYILFQAQSSYVLGKPIIVGFTLASDAEADLWILKWYTPLEGIKGKILQVTCDRIHDVVFYIRYSWAEDRAE